MDESRKRSSAAGISDAKKAKLSDGASGACPREISIESAHVMSPWPYAFIMTATSVYVGNKDRIVEYDTMTRREIGSIPVRGFAEYISLSRDEKSLFVACMNGIARIIDLATRKAVVLDGHVRVVHCIIQGKGTDVLTCSDDGTIRRWNSMTGDCLMIRQERLGQVNHILYEEATNRIFSALNDKTIIVLNGDTGMKIGVMKGHDGQAISLAQVNSTTIASCSYDGTIKLWDTATLACIRTISNGSIVYSVATTPDGQYLISGSYDTKVRVWSVVTGHCMYTFSHHSGRVTRVTVSPCGRFIASGGGRLFLLKISPPFSFVIRENVLVHDGREQSLSLLSDGTIRSNSDLITTVTSTSTCSLVSENQIVVSGSDSVEFIAPSTSAAQLWTEAISAVAADLALHPDDRARSADQMIRRYRFNLLQTILVHRRERGTRKWHIPMEIMQIVGTYCF